MSPTAWRQLRQPMQAWESQLRQSRQASPPSTGIPGRMEWINLGQDFLAVVDFAHTPHALRQALAAAKGILEGRQGSGRIICVFGSAGLRDRAKRRMMAEVAVELADKSIFTAEDPRTESLGDILAEMAAGAQ